MQSDVEATRTFEIASPESFYHSLVDSLPQNILRKDAEGRFTFANRRYCEMVGVSLDEIVGKTDYDLFPADLATKYREDDRAVMARGVGYETVEEHQAASGERLYVQVIKTPLFDSTCREILGLQCIFWDVTAQKRAEEALSESEERFRRMFEEAPVAYHEIDTEGIIRRVNQTECALLGYQAWELAGRSIWDFMAPEDREASREWVRKRIAEKQSHGVVTRSFLRRDGSRLLVEIHQKLIEDRDGRVTGSRATLLDITERRRTEEILARQTQELARSNIELEQFAYVASHDLQEPLRKIQTFGDLLKTKCRDTLSDQGRDYLTRMQNAAGRMQKLIDDLLSLSRVRTKAQHFAPVDLTAVARAVLSDLEVRVKQLDAEVDVGNLPVIQADPAQMSQLLQNLIGNALKFHRKDSAPRVRIRGRLIGGMCELVVEDDGIGFDEKHLDRIFQVFQRLHGRGEYEGTGIGLSVCRRIAERHSGTITARSTPGEGSQFIVTLPAEPLLDEPLLDEPLLDEQRTEGNHE